jgi:hypothetical protein
MDSKNKVGVTADRQFCACDRHLGDRRARSGQRPAVPNPAVRDHGLEHPVSSKCCSRPAIRVERWGGMHPQVGKLGNIDSWRLDSSR